jgi:hypothetical protein
MIRYHLDDLGWCQFEMLVQSLVKAACGLGVESWGQRGDFGRDAYTAHPMVFPSSTENSGPFLFQVKFIENANASGANSNQLLLRAVTIELQNIDDRCKKEKWLNPHYYTFITNAPVSGYLRQRIADQFTNNLPGVTVVIWGGLDVCDLLDQNPSIRKSFPQLLSLRDLDELIEIALGKEARARSSIALELAKEFAPVFVPTNAYAYCWEVLDQHNFSVLEGPPEVGKTAIAWMVTLAQASLGWEAFVCDKPEDLFQLHSGNRKQIFIADDAFGRTEYDPTRGRDWEQNMERVLRYLDKNHWLIWTSRKHILERATRVMDMQGKATHFPKPVDILVDASQLTQKEKALILYRHAKACHMEGESKEFIKKFARGIVDNPYFTPERIRKFVNDVLPDLLKDISEGKINQQRVAEEIYNSIQTPTKRMRKSFRALSLNHKLLLTAVLESGFFISKEELKKIFLSKSADIKSSERFEELLEDLSESFIRLHE